MTRLFDGSNDEIRTAIGNNNITGAITMVAVFKRNDTSYSAIIGLHTSGGTATYALEIQDDAGGGQLDFTGKVDWGSSVAAPNSDGWVLIAVTKAAGTSTPRAHKYVYNTNTWTHVNGSSTLADQASVSGGTVRFGEWQDVDDFGGDLGAAAIWDSALTDDQIESLPHSLSTWLSMNPTGMWVFDQAVTSYLVVDWTGGGANETTRVGTSISGISAAPIGYGAQIIQVTTTDTAGPQEYVAPTPTGGITYAGTAPNVWFVASPGVYLQVSASSDDALEIAGTVTLTDGSPLSDDAGEWLAWRFQNVAIPPGSTIRRAKLWLQVASGSVDEPLHTFYGEDADDSVTFAASANNISSRSRTTASVLWDETNLGASGSEFWSPPNLYAVIQEIVDRGGWASGNSISILCEGSDPTRDLSVIMYDSAASSGARLFIQFDPPDVETWVGQVSASADDARQSGTTVTINGTTLEADATTEYIGLRWDNIDIPQGATIEKATLVVTPTGTGEDEPDHLIWADDSDDAAQFTTGASDISSRSATTATVSWTSADLVAHGSGSLFHASPDIKTIIQEIVDRGGWVSGNAIALILQGSADAARDLVIHAYDGNPEYAARLEIQYAVSVEYVAPTPTGGITYAGTSASVFVNITAYTPTGGISYAGTSPSVFVNITAYTPSGGITYTGAADLVVEQVVSVSGGITYAGTSPSVLVRVYTYSPSGILTYAGTADLVVEQVVSVSGGISYAGTSASLFVNITAYTPTGGIAYAGTSASVFVNTTAYTPTGGITYSGDADIVVEQIGAVSGGITYAGSADLVVIQVVGVSGGITYAGTAASLFVNIYEYSPSGGITYAGSADLLAINVVAPSGGIQYGGTAATQFNGASTYTYSPSGGIVYDGTAAKRFVNTVVYMPTGGISYSGTAATVFVNTIVYTPSGGISYSGAAGTQFNDVTIFTYSVSGGVSYSGSGAHLFLEEGIAPVEETPAVTGTSSSSFRTTSRRVNRALLIEEDDEEDEDLILSYVPDLSGLTPLSNPSIIKIIQAELPRTIISKPLPKLFSYSGSGGRNLIGTSRSRNIRIYKSNNPQKILLGGSAEVWMNYADETRELALLGIQL